MSWKADLPRTRTMLGSTMCFPPSIFSIVVLPTARKTKPPPRPINITTAERKKEKEGPKSGWWGVTCAVGAEEEAPLAGVEGEADVLDKRRRAGRRAAVDARVGEGEVADLHRWRHRGLGAARSGGRRSRGWSWSRGERERERETSVVAGRASEGGREPAPVAW